MARAGAALAEAWHDAALTNDELGARLAGLKGLMDPPRFAVGDVVRTKSKVTRFSSFTGCVIFFVPSFFLPLPLPLSLWLKKTGAQVHFLTAGSLLDRAEERAARMAARRSQRRLVLVSSEPATDGGMGCAQFRSDANGSSSGGSSGLALSSTPLLNFEVFARRSGGDYEANGRLLAQLSSASSTPYVATPLDTRGPTCSARVL